MSGYDAWKLSTPPRLDPAEDLDAEDLDADQVEASAEEIDRE